MTLRELLEAMEAPAMTGAEGTEITGLCYDSRRVRGGELFFGLSGQKQDGQAFVRQALAAGAVAAVVGPDFREPGLPLVRVEEPRRALASAAVRFFGEPSRALTVVGVTGTNGKTTTTWMLEAIFRAAGRVPGVLGTTGVRVAGEARPSTFTTPEAPELQGLLREMRERGVEAVALEVSSHALAQRRCYALECDVAVFTNLSHDHLDYHGTLEAYLDAKLMLFDGRNNPRPAKRTTAVVNLDDPAAARVCAAAALAGLRVAGFGRSADAAFRIGEVAVHADGLDLSLEERGTRTAVRLPLLGRFNAWNAAGAFAAARALGIPAAAAARGLAGAPGVPGRLERIVEGQPFEVVVDYAHTPDALERALAAVREHARGRVLVVFGCGGDRDRAKRPVMGRAARAGADQVWVTSDNPRSEDPAAIAAEIVAGAGGPVHLELDRRAAIASALEAARSGDAVLIAGKGHETTQTLGDRVLPFDDREVARSLLRARGGSGR